METRKLSLIDVQSARPPTPLASRQPSAFAGRRTIFSSWPAALKALPWPYLLLALLVRAWLTAHTGGVIDADEATVGIQALHILHGEHPVYFYGQSYMGSLEAYLVALVFSLAGPSVWTLRAEAILLSLVIVWLTWRLARALAHTAHLPRETSRWFIHCATLFAALPPLYDTVAELRMLGGYVETFLFMLLLLLSALRLAERWRPNGTTTARELAWRWAGLGLVVGLSLWTNLLISSALLSASLWLTWSLLRQRGRLAYPLTSLLALPTALLGLLPALLWGLRHQWTNVTYIFALGSIVPDWVVARYHDRISIISALTSFYSSCVTPRLLGGSMPITDPLALAFHTPALVAGLIGIALTLASVLLSLLWRQPLLLQARRLAALPLLFGGCTALVFCATTTATIGLASCSYDVAGRYATPLMLALPFFYATPCALLIQVASRLLADHSRWTTQSLSMTRWRIRPVTNLSSLAKRRPAYSVPFALEVEENMPLKGIRKEKNARELRLWLVRCCLLLSLLLIILTQLYTYMRSDPGHTFQSPYCTGAPANNDLLIQYLQRQHIRYVWANNWIAYPLIFKTQGQISASDPLPLLRQYPNLDRLPTYTAAVLRAERPSLISITLKSVRYPRLLRVLDQLRVTYRMARFPSEPGVDLLVVTPLNHTVLPYTSWHFYGAFLCTGQ